MTALGQRLQSWALLCEQRVRRADRALASAEQYDCTHSGGGKLVRLYASARRSSLLCEDCVQTHACELAKEEHLQMQHNERIRDRVNQSRCTHIAYSAAVSSAEDAVCSAECSKRAIIFHVCKHHADNLELLCELGCWQHGVMQQAVAPGEDSLVIMQVAQGLQPE